MVDPGSPVKVMDNPRQNLKSELVGAMPQPPSSDGNPNR